MSFIVGSSPIPIATPIAAKHSAPTNAINSSTTQREGAAIDLEQRQDLQCPECLGRSIYEEYLDGEIVCRNCGHVFEGALFFENAADPEDSRDRSGGLVRVNVVGRAVDQPQAPSFPFTQRSPESVRKLRHTKRNEAMRNFLASVGRQNGLGAAQYGRAFFLWKIAMESLRLTFWTRAARAGLACIYLAAKEARKGISLVEIAVRAEMSPFEIGTTYKAVKAALVQRQTLFTDAAFFNVEDDPWIMLQRIMTIGSSDSVQRGDTDLLTPEIQEALGVNAEAETRNSRLRGLLASAQKCMTVATDAGIATGRQLHAMVAACLVVSLEVELLFTKCPDELFQFAGLLFSSHATTVMARYRELRQSMLLWARRLPFVSGASRIKPCKLVFYMKDVLQYFGHLNEQNQQLWTMLDKGEDSSLGGRDDVLGEEYGKYGPSEQEVLEDVFVSPSKDRVGMDWNQDSPSDLEPTLSLERSHPPSYMIGLQKKSTKRRNVQAAKSLVDGSHLTQPLTQTTPPAVRRNRLREEEERQRVEMIRQLMVLGMRTEEELLEANDVMLDYWLRSDLATHLGIRGTRTQEELNSDRLTAKDLEEEELRLYLRSASDAEALLRVMSSIYDEAEQTREFKEAQRELLKKRVAHQKQLNIKKRAPLPASVSLEPGRKRVRSSKLNLEALSDAGAEDAAEKAGEGEQEGGQGIDQRTEREETEELYDESEADGDGDEGYSDQDHGDDYDDYNDYGDD